MDRLLSRAGSDHSDVLVLRGEAGVGKTALLNYLARRADGFVITRATGVQSEIELAYAVLHQVCAPFLDRITHLPEPQRQALGIVFGSLSAKPPDRFLVGLAVLGLFAEVAEAAPLLCVVDDAQWIDIASAQTLTFVARRLAAERIGMLFAVRDESDADERSDAFDPLPTLVVRGLADADAAALFDSAIPGPFDARVRSRIIAEARGNPLALLELPHDLDTAELAFGIGSVDPTALTGRIERGFVGRVTRLPPATRQLMLIAAADPSGDVTLLWRAATRVGIPVDAVVPAQEAGLLELGAQVRFRHPLMRSAVYRAASPEERRKAHKVLAESTTDDTDPDYLAWHRAEAADGLDEVVAAELESTAVRAQARGGWAAAAAFLTRSMELTPDPGRRARRALAAAHARLQAGATDAAHGMLAIAAAGPLSDLDDARRSCSELRSRSRPPAAGRLRRCCFSRRSGSSLWTPPWHGRRISMPTPRRSSRAVLQTAVTLSPTWRGRSSTRAGATRVRRFLPLANCCWTASRRSSHAATRTGYRCFAAHSPP